MTTHSYIVPESPDTVVGVHGIFLVADAGNNPIAIDPSLFTYNGLSVYNLSPTLILKINITVVGQTIDPTESAALIPPNGTLHFKADSAALDSLAATFIKTPTGGGVYDDASTVPQGLTATHTAIINFVKS